MKFFWASYLLIINAFFTISCKLVTPKETQLSADRYAMVLSGNQQENITIKHVYQSTNLPPTTLTNFALYSAIFCEGDTSISHQAIFNHSEQVFHVLSNKQCTITIERFVLDNLEYLPTTLSPEQKLVFTILPDKTIQIPLQPILYQTGSTSYYLKGTSSENNILEFIILDAPFSRVYIK